MQRVLPCLAACHGLPALTTKTGGFHTLGQMMTPDITYICARCGRPSRLTADHFHSLPSDPNAIWSDAR